MKTKQTYREGESPSERLRNKLSPLFFIVDVLANDPSILVDGPTKDLLLSAAKKCQDSQQDIRDHIDDAEMVDQEYLRLRELDDLRRERRRQEHADATDGEELDEWEADYLEGRELRGLDEED